METLNTEVQVGQNGTLLHSITDCILLFVLHYNLTITIVTLFLWQGPKKEVHLSNLKYNSHSCFAVEMTKMSDRT